MSRLPEQNDALGGIYETLNEFLGKRGGVCILNPQTDHCSFIIKSTPGISVSLHNVRGEKRIRLVRVNPDDYISFSFPNQPERISPRRNLIDILQGIGLLIDQAGTTVKSIS